jgi:hypothetical protein
MSQMVGRQLAGQFPRRMTAHPVADHKQMPVLVPLFPRRGKRDAEIVLIVVATHAYIALGGDLQVVIPSYNVFFHANRYSDFWNSPVLAVMFQGYRREPTFSPNQFDKPLV